MDKSNQPRGSAGGQGFGGTPDIHYDEPTGRIVDQLKQSGATDLLVIGRKADGAAFAWSNKDKAAVGDLVREATPALVG